MESSSQLSFTFLIFLLTVAFMKYFSRNHSHILWSFHSVSVCSKWFRKVFLKNIFCMAYFQSYDLFLNWKSMKIHTKTHTFPFCLIWNYILELPSDPKFHLPYNVHLIFLSKSISKYLFLEYIYIQSFKLGFGNILTLILGEQIQLSTKIYLSIKSVISK